MKKISKEKGRNTKRNKLGVKNSLVNNINARKKKGISKPKTKKTVSKKAYSGMKKNWGKKKQKNY
ncbi:hypothetical protein [Dyadobacter sp. 3J3]|uniref:hypothetical protein n=1 Tax=Dyadobacter sp. 3J3 TaxID=2606600 RepID=UPI001357A442|nr:hypothetical protein [Dyadobacter sp. 3J3]